MSGVRTLNGKTLFISGASRGIGLAIALRAARDGANITIAAKTDKPHPKLPGTIYTAAAEIEEAGGKALAVVCDIREEAQVTDAVAKTVETFGGIDICVNNASAIQITGVLSTDMKRYDLMQQINTRGVRRQMIWRNLVRRIEERWSRLLVDVTRRGCGAASADVRWSAV